MQVVSEVQLRYDRQIVPQDTGYWCGPASAQIVLNTRGVQVGEADLARQLGTTTAGTNYIGLIEKVLNRYLPEANYTSVYLEKDPPTKAQKDALWANLQSSINAGYGVVMNWVSPPRNRPKGVKGSVSPNYGWNTVWHYVSAMGIDVDEKAVWIADSGFSPQGYWISLDQCATLIPPKGYCYARPTKPAEPVTTTPAVAPDDDGDPLHSSRSPYREDNTPIMSALDAVLNIDAMCHAGLIVEPAALRGELWAIEKVARLANGDGPGAKLWWDDTKSDEWAISKARFLLQLIEETNPNALVEYLASKGKL